MARPSANDIYLSRPHKKVLSATGFSILFLGAFGCLPVLMAMAWTAIPDRIVLQDEYENSRLFLWLKLPICGVLMGTMVSVLTAALMSVQEQALVAMLICGFVPSAFLEFFGFVGVDHPGAVQAAAAVVALVCTTLATYGLRKCGSGTKHTLLPNTDRDEGYDLTPPENNAENHARVAAIIALPLLLMSAGMVVLTYIASSDSLTVRCVTAAGWGVLVTVVSIAMTALNPAPRLQLIVEFHSEVFYSIWWQMLLLQLRSWPEFWLVMSVGAGPKVAAYCLVLTESVQSSLPGWARHPVYVHLHGMRGVSARFYLSQLVSLCTPIYCLVFIEFVRRTNYEAKYYPTLQAIDNWERTRVWYGISMGIEIAVFLFVCVVHALQEHFDFAPYTHGYKSLRQLATTVATIPTCGYMLVTLALWQHHFKPVHSG